MLPITPSLCLSIQNDIAICHKETQTSKTDLIDSYTTTTENTSDENSVKVIEFSEVVQDPTRPKTITLIKDVYAQDIQDHNSPSGSATDDALANRYKYCREVIKPYLKDYPKDCPVSDDQLIRDALNNADEEFPDYEPCFETSDIIEDISDKKDSFLDTLKDSDKSSVRSGDSKDSTCKKGKHIISDISNCNLSRINTLTNLKSIMNQQKDGCAEKAKPKGCPTKGKPGCPPPIETCKDEAAWPPPEPPYCNTKTVEGTSKCNSKVPSSACKDDSISSPKKEKSCEQHRSNINDIKHKFGIECDSSTTPPKETTTIETHIETIATIKTAVEDFFGKVYKTTKDAVTIIKTESAKHLGRITAQKSASNTDIIPQRVHENKSTETITSFNYYRSTDNPDSKSQSTDNEEVDDNLSNAGQVIGKIFAKVDSTISILSDHVDLQKVKSLLTFEDLTNRSSPFDKVKSDEEDPVSTSTSIPNSVFSAIKTRIVSMFSDGESGVKESASQRSNISEDTDDNAKRKKR